MTQDVPQFEKVSSERPFPERFTWSARVVSADTINRYYELVAYKKTGIPSHVDAATVKGVENVINTAGHRMGGDDFTGIKEQQVRTRNRELEHNIVEDIYFIIEPLVSGVEDAIEYEGCV